MGLWLDVQLHTLATAVQREQRASARDCFAQPLPTARNHFVTLCLLIYRTCRGGCFCHSLRMHHHGPCLRTQRTCLRETNNGTAHIWSDDARHANYIHDQTPQMNATITVSCPAQPASDYALVHPCALHSSSVHLSDDLRYAASFLPQPHI